MENQEAEIFKITSTGTSGSPVVAYVMPGLRRLIARSMSEEYGNVTVEPMMLADVPAGILPPSEQD